MGRDSVLDVIVIAYIAALAGYAGYRLALRNVRRESELAGLRERIWVLEEPIRKARIAEEEAKHAS